MREGAETEDTNIKVVQDMYECCMMMVGCPVGVAEVFEVEGRTVARIS